MGLGSFLANPIVGPTLQFAGDVLGGRANRRAQLQIASENRDLQREFARNGIMWKIEDAMRMGISPLAALGASGTSYSPIGIGDVSGGYSALSNLGQDLSRAYFASRPRNQKIDEFEVRSQANELERQRLSNDLLSAQIAAIRNLRNPAQTGPGVPIPDSVDYIDEFGNVYRGPSVDWAAGHQQSPFAGWGHMLRNTYSGRNIGEVLKLLPRQIRNEWQYRHGLLKRRPH